MSEKPERDSYSIARAYLNDFFDGLYLNGMPKGREVYRTREIARAGARYLKMIGVKEFPSDYANPNVARHLEELIDPRLVYEELSEMPDNSSLALGMVVGTAVFHPDSQLKPEQKDILISQAVGALQRVNAVEGDKIPDSNRGDIELFVKVFSSCAGDYVYDFETPDYRQHLRKILDQSEHQYERGRLDFKQTARRIGRGILEGLQAPSGLPHSAKDNRDDQGRRHGE